MIVSVMKTMVKLMVMMTMVQEEVDDEEIRNAYDFDLGEEEDVRAHSTRAEDFNFSEFIFNPSTENLPSQKIPSLTL